MIDWEVTLPWVYMHCSIYISAKFGVAVFKASVLYWPGGQSAMGISALFHICIDLPLDVPSLVWQYSRHLCLIGGLIGHGYICIVPYMYRSAIRCAKFGVVVFKASLLE